MFGSSDDAPVKSERHACTRSSTISGAPQREQPPAGGRANNARPNGVGHTRGNLHGGADFLERVSLAEQRDDSILLTERIGALAGNIKGHGLCNPLVDYASPTREATGGIQYMPAMGGSHAQVDYPGAAGAASSENWRSNHNYMANGAEGYGDFRSEHLTLQSPAKARARNLQPESKVVFGNGLWQGSPVSPEMR